MKYLKFWKPICIALIILYGSLTSSDNLDKIEFLSIPNIDKVIHFLFYLSLSITFISSLYKSTHLKLVDQYLLTIIFSISYGLIMEVLQFYVTMNRTADILDVVANTFGCILGVVLFNYLKNSILLKIL